MRKQIITGGRDTGVQNEMSVGQRLRHERMLLNWSQEKLAEKLAVSVLSINRWENDKVLPQPYYREQLCKLFNKSPAELGFISQKDIPLVSVTSPASLASAMPIWKMPHRRYMYFTGREDAILSLHDLLTARKMGVTAQICALSGLGGIGKTQIAVEYAYRYT